MKEREDRAEELLARAQEEIRRLREHVEALTTLSRLRRRRDSLHADDTLRWLEGWQARRRGYADHAVVTQMLEEYRQRRLAFAGIGASQPEPPARHQARRGDDVESWLKRDRDALLADSADWAQQAAAVVDDLLEEYRLHADTGTPLDAEVSER